MHRRVFLAALVAPALVACGGARTRPQEPATYVRVQNQSWLDQTVYVVRSGQRIRIGQVTGGSTQRLRLPASILFGATPLSFVVDPIGSQRQGFSTQIVVSPGEEVTLTIPPG
jgi:hypothetical protein